MTILLLCFVLSVIGLSLAVQRKECPAAELDKLCNAIQSNHFSTVSAFLGEWSDAAEVMNAGVCGGMSPLSLAAAMGHISIVETLLMLDKAVDVNYNEGGTALMLAASEGQSDVVALLLKSEGIDVNMIEVSTGGSALQAAALLGHVDIVSQLLQVSDVDVNIQSTEGYSPLMMAARGGHVAVVERLLKEDAVNIGLVDNAGENVLTSTASTGNHVIVSSILKSSKLVDVNHQNNADFSALMLASLLGHTSIVDDLLHKNADVNAKGKDDWTALLYAIAKGHTDIVKLLVTVENLDVNAECAQGWTASTLATHLEYAAILDLLEMVETPAF
jgi:uncharacterized protein